jgi:hypothetical protein
MEHVLAPPLDYYYHRTRSIPLFHFNGLCGGGLVKPRLKFGPAMLPSMLMAACILSAKTMNFDGLRLSTLRKLTI